MNKILVVIDNLDIGGVAKVARNFSDACSNRTDLTFDYICYSQPCEETIKELSVSGGRYFVIPRVTDTNIPKYINTIRNIINENGPFCAIHAHTAYFIWLACYAAKKEGILIRIGHAHGSEGPNNSLTSKFVEKVGRILNRRYCTHMLTCADSSGKYTFGNNFEFMPNIIKYNNIEPISYQQRIGYSEEFNIPKIDRVVIGYMGVIGLVKNTKYLIGIMRKIVELNKNYYMVLAGSGPDEEIIKEMIVKENLTANVQLIGQRIDNYELLQFFDVLVMPSYSEGMSLAILESQICGTPCVVSKGVPLTNDIGMGLVYQCNTYDTDEWVSRIELALKNSNPLTQSERNQYLINNKYDENSIVERLIKIYGRA